MSAVTGVVAGFAAAVGAVALYRLVERRTRPLRSALVKGRGRNGGEAVIEFERDPATGVYRPK